MAYFANRTEFEGYWDKYCGVCDRWQEVIGCVVWQMQERHNEDEYTKPDSLLHRMIPMDEHGAAEQCIGFVILDDGFPKYSTAHEVCKTCGKNQNEDDDFPCGDTRLCSSCQSCPDECQGQFLPLGGCGNCLYYKPKEDEA